MDDRQSIKHAKMWTVHNAISKSVLKFMSSSSLYFLGSNKYFHNFDMPTGSKLI